MANSDFRRLRRLASSALLGQGFSLGRLIVQELEAV